MADVDYKQLEKNFAKDLSNLFTLVKYAADVTLNGTYSERRPDLGRMFRCRACGTRRRPMSERCCSAKFTETQRAWDSEKGFHQVDCAPRENAQPIGNAFIKRITHKRHGQSRSFKVRQLTYLFQNDEQLLGAAFKELKAHYPLLAELQPAGIPSFTERYWIWKRKQEVKAERLRVRAIRKQNRGE